MASSAAVATTPSTAGPGNDVLDGAEGDDFLIGASGDDTIIGGGGIDTVVYRNAPGAVQVDLYPYASGGHTTGADGHDSLDGIENVLGSNFGDLIRGSAFANVLQGRGGADILYGDPGDDPAWQWSADTLTGGTGADRFAYDWWQQSTPGARDTITDFEGAGVAGGDRIDLAAVYAGTLAFRGTGAFTGVGQVHVTDSGPDTLIEVNLTGDAAPEMAILAQDGTATASQWTAGDFIL
ncbi:MAG: M10 family metallopeptidase C-terminal domain-containing protein [Geminicoccaceae bacterium]